MWRAVPRAEWEDAGGGGCWRGARVPPGPGCRRLISIQPASEQWAISLCPAALSEGRQTQKSKGWDPPSTACSQALGSPGPLLAPLYRDHQHPSPHRRGSAGGAPLWPRTRKASQRLGVPRAGGHGLSSLPREDGRASTASLGWGPCGGSTGEKAQLGR